MRHELRPAAFRLHLPVRLIALIWALAVSTGISAEPLTVATYTWPPFLDRTLERHGLLGAITEEAANRAGIETRLVDQTWSRALTGVEVGEYDILAGVWKSPARESTLKFTRPVAENRVVFVKRRDATFSFVELEATRGEGLALGVTADFAYDNALAAFRFAPVRTENYVMQNLLRLLDGSIDVAVMDAAVFAYHVKTYISSRAGELEISPRPLATYGLHLAVSAARPDAEDLTRRLDAALAEMDEDGTLEALRARYVPVAGGAVTPGS